MGNNNPNCPSCGKELKISNPYSIVSLKCGSCGTPIAIENGHLNIDASTSRHSIPRPMSALSLGMRGVFPSIGKVMIIGRICYRSGSYVWNEWLLLRSTGSYCWLIEDDESFSISQKFTPKNPFSPDEITENSIPFENSMLYFEDRGISTVVGFEGELTWKVTIGDQTNYIEGYSESYGHETLYSAEWTDTEILFFKGTELTYREVYRIFGVNAPIPKAAQEEEGAGATGASLFGSDWQTVLVASVFLFIASLLGLIISLNSGESVKAGQLPEIESAEGTILYGPFNLQHKGKPIRINLSTNLHDNNVEGRVRILNADKKPLKDFNFNLYHSEGEESDSSKLNIRKYYILGETGNYYIHIAGDTDDMDLLTKIRVSVYQKAFTSLPFAVLLIISGLPVVLFIIVYIIKNRSEDDDD